MKTVFLDANILFSASLGHTHMHGYFKNLANKATLLTSDQVYGEVERNLRKKYPQSFGELAKVMERVSLVADAGNMHVYSMIAEKDRHVIAAAVLAKADYLLTGDVKDFGAFLARSWAGCR